MKNEQQIIEEIKKIDAALSYENLHWDGERNPRDAAREERDLKTKRKRLVKELGRKPTNEELNS